VKAQRKWLSGFTGALLAFLFLLCPLEAALADGWSLKDRGGVHYRLSELKGKWVLVNFWAPWCPVCLQEMPELDALQKLHTDVLVIGVAIMYRKSQEVSDVLRTHSVFYPIVMGNEDIASDFGEMNAMPISFLYDPSGELVGRHDGPLTQKDVERVMAQKPGSSQLFSR